MNRKELQKLAAVRLREAKLLLSANAPDGAYYLAGYAVECALKASIARKTKRHHFPEKDTVQASYSHDLMTCLTRPGSGWTIKQPCANRISRGSGRS
jgi:HEPN domain-containing protein